MLRTTEARWFYRGAIPTEVDGWFQSLGSKPEKQSPRTDYYLRIQDSDSLGLKLREGNIEAKQRTGRQEQFSFNDKATGLVENWCKWSFPLVQPVNEAGLSSVHWVGIEKQRTLFLFGPPNGESLNQLPGFNASVPGCGVELASVSLTGQDAPWWSIGFEAFGPVASLHDTLLSVATGVLATSASPTLSLDASLGYAAWLQTVIPENN